MDHTVSTGVLALFEPPCPHSLASIPNIGFALIRGIYLYVGRLTIGLRVLEARLDLLLQSLTYHGDKPYTLLITVVNSIGTPPVVTIIWRSLRGSLNYCVSVRVYILSVLSTVEVYLMELQGSGSKDVGMLAWIRGH